MSDFGREYVASGLVRGQFAHLSLEDKMSLLRLMARVSEASYRRGFQQGFVLRDNFPERIVGNLAAWRYDESLDDAISPDGFPSSGTSLDRLDMEFRLSEVGLKNDAPENVMAIWGEQRL